MLDFTPHSRQFTPTPVLKTTDAVMLPVGNTPLYKNIDFMPSSKQPCCWRGPGFRYQICSGWSHLFIQVSEYLPDHNGVFNTSNDPDVTAAFNAGVIEARFSAAVWSCTPFGILIFLPLPRFASVTCARYLLLGANIP